MRDVYLQNLVKLSAAEKNQINAIYTAALKASQEMFVESSLNHNYPVFSILEGTVKYDPTNERGIFYPNSRFAEMLRDTSIKSKSSLFEKNLSRFAALLLHAYKDFNSRDTDAYKLWLSSGHAGSDQDFLNWIKKQSEHEQNSQKDN